MIFNIFQSRTARSFLFIGCLLGNFQQTLGYDLHYQAIKELVWAGAVKSSFWEKLSTIFKSDVFVETGTCMGSSLNNAKHHFKSLYSIELNPEFHQFSRNRFKDDKRIQLFFGDSPLLLDQILPKLEGRVCFWLDAHDDGRSTPIVSELESIKKYCPGRPVILVDDMYLFATSPNYPSLGDLHKQLLILNKDYDFVLLFDAALAFPAQMGITVSPVLRACTLSQLFESSKYNETFAEDIIEAEKTIGSCSGKEKRLIKKLCQLYPDIPIYHVWIGLIHMHDGSFGRACDEFRRAREIGCEHWRVLKYWAQAARAEQKEN